MVFQSYYYCVCFCLVGFDLFSYIDRITYLVLCAFVVYSDCLVVFVYMRKYCVISSAIITPFLKDGLPLKFG